MSIRFLGVIILLFQVISLFNLGCKDSSAGKEDQGATDSVTVRPSIPFDPLFSDSLRLSTKVILLDSSSRKSVFPGTSGYSSSDTVNILAFRGGHRRDKASSGTISSVPLSLEKEWTFITRTDQIHQGSDGSKYSKIKWGGGTGWTGQPLLVRWDREMKIKLGISDPSFINDPEAIEVIAGSLSGDIYFLNLKNGKPTREPLTIDGPIKGTVSVDPRLNGLLYVGQGIGKGKRFGAYIIDMVKRVVAFHQNGRDDDADRGWGAFDSNPIVDEANARLFWPAENGCIYTFDVKDPSQLKVVSKMKYRHSDMRRYGLEAGMAAIGDYGFFGDNSGNLMCIQLSTMKPVWLTDNYDDTDASIVVSLEKDQYYLYTGNEVDHRQPKDISSLRKLDARTGKEVWRYDLVCAGSKIQNKDNSGGLLATPVLGKRNASHLVLGLFSRAEGSRSARLVAVDKENGAVRYTVDLQDYSWATPVDFYDREGNMYLFLSDVTGNLYLLNGQDGQLIWKGKEDGYMESSPVMVNDRIIVGTRGKQIHCYRVKTR